MKKPPMPKTMIKAMEELIKQYKAGTHTANFKDCPLCAAVGVEGWHNAWHAGAERKCDKCCWYFITGKYCNQVDDHLNQTEAKRLEEVEEFNQKVQTRIKELEGWIELYKS